MHGIDWMQSRILEKSFWKHQVQRLNGIIHQISSINRNIFSGISWYCPADIWPFDLVSDFQVAEHWGHCRAHSAYKLYQVWCLPQGLCCFTPDTSEMDQWMFVDFDRELSYSFIVTRSLEGAASGALALMPFVPCCQHSSVSCADGWHVFFLFWFFFGVFFRMLGSTRVKRNEN